MTDRPVRTRYAPSPTGDPHVGNIRTALFAWAMARANKGRFILRIEDTDQARLVPGSIDAIYASLRWLGIDWDEGPDIGGPVGPYVQSERLAGYREAAEKLLHMGRAYRCFCTPERLVEMREAQAAAKRPPGYDGLCRTITPEESEARARDEVFVVRFAMLRSGKTMLEDLIRGTVRFENSLQDDFVILKSDDFPTYHLAVVVDDTAMEISHAIRGDEWISSAPKHVQLYEALNSQPPLFAHMPLILGADQKKLSKRTGDTSLLDYRGQGYLPVAMVNFLALLGWSLDDKTTIIPPEEFVRHFTIERVVANPAVFDVERLDYLNGHYIREMDPADWSNIVSEACEADLPDSIARPLPPDLLAAAAPLVQERLSKASDIATMLEFLFADGELGYPASLLSERVGNDTNRAKEVVGLARAGLQTIEVASWGADSVEAALRGLEGPLDAKLRKWISVLYVAIMGRPQGIPLFDSVALLGREKALSRLDSAAASLASS